MKKILLLVLTFIFIQDTYSQSIVEVERLKKNTIWLEFYSPVMTSSIDTDLDNVDPFLIDDSELEKRTNKSFAFGIAYERLFKNDLVIRSRFGLSIIDLKKETYNEEVFENFEGEAMYKDRSKAEFNQKQYNLFLGVAKKIRLSDRMNIDVGLEGALISYQKANYNTFQRTEQINDFYKQRTLSEANVTYGKATNIGVGPIIKPEYTLGMGLSFSAEIQLFFMKSKADNTRRTEVYNEAVYSEAGIEQIYEVENTTETDYFLSEWSWSQLSPLFRIGYRF